MPETHDWPQGRPGKHGRGPSSFWLQDPHKVFAALNLSPGDCFLDLGCGPGEYAIQAAKTVGGSGRVHALDRGEEVLALCRARIKAARCADIQVMEADITRPLPLEENSVDVCLMATVLHILQVRNAGLTLFGEIHRVLKPGGRYAVLECKKEDQPFGPPRHVRLSPEEVEAALDGRGFKRFSLTDLGFSYLIQFTAE